MMVFDKTGTLTKGTFEVIEIKAYGNFNEDELLYYAAHGEYFSNHPIAKSIIKKFDGDINKEDIANYEEISGFGIKANIRGKEVLLENDKLMSNENIDLSHPKLLEQ